MNTAYEQPDYAALESYDDINTIRQTFPPLTHTNKKDIKCDNLENSLYFVIRTHGEDNVHRAMKYGVWTSSSRKNQKLSDAYRQVKKSNGEVYLFFTEINSICFSGVAKLTSDFDEKAHFKYWLVENKWFGTFKIEWLYVKDIDFFSFDTLKQNQTLEGSREVLKPVHDLIDVTELLKENGKKMLEIFQTQESDKNLFTDFKTLDDIEIQCREQRTNNQKFDRKYFELIKVFEQIPFSFSVASYERRKLHRKQNQMYIQQFYYNPYTNQQQYYQQQYQPQQQAYGNQQQAYGYPPYQQQYPPQQQQYPQQQQQQQNYWQQNDGFYNQNQPTNYDSNSQQQYQQYDNNQQHQQQNDEDQQPRNEPLQHRFAVKGKKPKNEKRLVNNKKGGSTKYVPKQDYQQDPNFVNNHQQDSDEDDQQQNQEQKQ